MEEMLSLEKKIFLDETLKEKAKPLMGLVSIPEFKNFCYFPSETMELLQDPRGEKVFKIGPGTVQDSSSTNKYCLWDSFIRERVHPPGFPSQL